MPRDGDNAVAVGMLCDQVPQALSGICQPPRRTIHNVPIRCSPVLQNLAAPLPNSGIGVNFREKVVMMGVGRWFPFMHTV